MIYEYRFYEVCEGRLAEEVARMAEVAIEPASDTNTSLFDQHSVPRPKGAWIALSGPRLPLFGYILCWDSLRQRDECFPSFWADARWHAIRDRAKESDHVPIVNRIDNWLMEPSSVWVAAHQDDAASKIGGLHEMRIHTHYAGDGRDACHILGNIEIPHLQLMGATLLGAFDVIIGPKDAIVSFLSWPDFETRERAMSNIDVEVQLNQALERFGTKRGRALFRSVESYLLKPTNFGLPLENFGLSKQTLMSYQRLFPSPSVTQS